MDYEVPHTGTSMADPICDVLMTYTLIRTHPFASLMSQTADHRSGNSGSRMDGRNQNRCLHGCDTIRVCHTYTCSNTNSTQLTCITGAWDGPGAEPCANRCLHGCDTTGVCHTYTCSNTKSTRLTCITGAWDGPGAEPCAPLSDSVKGHGVFIVCVHPEVLGASRLCRTAYSRLIRVHAR